MKNLLIALSCLLFLHSAGTQVSYVITKGEIRIEGTSTLHDWSATTTDLEGTALFAFEGDTPIRIDRLEASTKVRSIKSEKGATMDKNMYKALKADAHPVLRFKLTKTDYLKKVGNGFQVSITGDLTVAGTTKPVTITGSGKRNTNGFTFEGSFKLKMTDFNVEPPSLFLGTLNTGDEVTISYLVGFSPAKSATR